MAKGADADALEAIENAVALVQDVNDVRWEAKLLVLKANILSQRGEAEQALQVMHEARNIHRESSDCSQDEALLLRSLAEVHVARGDVTHALQCALDQRELFTKVDDKKGEAISCLLITRVHLAAGNSEKALTVAEEGASLFQGIKDMQGEASAQEIVAELHFGCKNLSEALTAGKLAARLFREAGNWPGQVRALQTISNVHVENDSPDDARKATEEALRTCRKYMTDKRQEVQLLMQLANVSMAVVVKESHGTVHVENVQINYQNFQPATSQAMPSQQQQKPDAQPEEVAIAKKGLELGQVQSLIMTALQTMVGTDEDVPLDAPLMDSGLDSLSSVQFRNDLQQQTGLNLPASIMFDYPTTHALSERLVELSME
jgi:tetratricopeptide (TPR) repeat protein